MGRAAFHCVPDFCGQDGDAVERVPTGFRGALRDGISEGPLPRGLSLSAAPQGDGMPAECGPPCWLSVTAVAAWSAVGALCSAAR